VAASFLAAMLSQDKVKALLSSAHISIDGTLLEAWTSLKSFRPKDGSGEPADPGRNGERNFHGERRRNDSRASMTDPEARLFRKGTGQRSAAVRWFLRPMATQRRARSAGLLSSARRRSSR
jgi:hypothetical protein